MRILAVGDVCGAQGVDFLCGNLSKLKRLHEIDFVVVNGENATMRGISPQNAEDIFSAGADVITLGNHAFDNKKIFDFLDDNPNIIRPVNMPSMRPGNGYRIIDDGRLRICVISLIGRYMMDYHCENPFTAVDQIIKATKADLYIVDFHAESTSEKRALAFYLDGRASVLFGTHTHVQTADEQVMPGGLGYITDVGMTGGVHSVIGVYPDMAVAKFLGEITPRFEQTADGMCIQGAIFDVAQDGKCTDVQRLIYK